MMSIVNWKNNLQNSSHPAYICCIIPSITIRQIGSCSSLHHWNVFRLKKKKAGRPCQSSPLTSESRPLFSTYIISTCQKLLELLLDYSCSLGVVKPALSRTALRCQPLLSLQGVMDIDANAEQTNFWFLKYQKYNYSQSLYHQNV